MVQTEQHECPFTLKPFLTPGTAGILLIDAEGSSNRSLPCPSWEGNAKCRYWPTVILNRAVCFGSLTDQFLHPFDYIGRLRQHFLRQRLHFLAAHGFQLISPLLDFR
jgi:hypothetical protein